MLTLFNLLYDILFPPSAPSYLKELFEFSYLSHSLSLCSAYTYQFKTPVHTSKFYEVIHSTGGPGLAYGYQNDQISYHL